MPYPDLPIDEFESEFAKVLPLAEENIWRTHDLMKKLLLSDARLDSMPEFPIFRLHVGATANFLGVIQCLKTRYSSIGALSLLRGLIESWTHLYFIADETEGGTPAQRAVRYEAGVLSEWGDAQKKAKPEPDLEEVLRRKYARIMELWADNGGTGKLNRRTRRHVSPTWKKITALPEFKGIEVLYDSSSLAVHVSAVDFLFASDDSQITLKWVRPGVRPDWLLFAAACFENLTYSALESIPSVDSQALVQDSRTRWLEIFNSPVLAKPAATTEESEQRA